MITKAPLGGEDTGPSPIDRGKKGTKRSVLTDQRDAPLAVEITRAHTPDKTVALAPLDGLVVDRPEKVVYRLHHLCLDKGYDYAEVIEGVEERDYHLHVSKRQAEKSARLAQKKHPARRWGWKEPMLGTIGSGVCWSDGRRRIHITKHSFT